VRKHIGMHRPLPYRGRYGDERPPGVASLALPPARLPLVKAGRLRKRWRYVGLYGEELMLCAATVSIGPFPQVFWAVWDRAAQHLHERTRAGRRGVRLPAGRVLVEDDGVRIDLDLAEDAGIETVSAYGRGYAWTRKQAGIRARGTVVLDGRERLVDGLAVIDDSAGYPLREVSWRWSAAVGSTPDGTPLAWNLVEGIHDEPGASERTVWLDGRPREVGAVTFAADLSEVRGAGGEILRFAEEARREHDDERPLFHTRYAQPFGTFTGELEGGIAVGTAYGVMERHDVRW